MCVYFILIQVISYILSHLIILLIRKHFGEMNTYPFVLQAKTLSLWEISVLIKVTELVTYKAGFKLRFAWFLSPCSLCTCLYFSLRITKTYIHLSFWILIWDLIISLLSGISFQTIQGKNKCLKKMLPDSLHVSGSTENLSCRSGSIGHENRKIWYFCQLRLFFLWRQNLGIEPWELPNTWKQNSMCWPRRVFF